MTIQAMFLELPEEEKQHCREAMAFMKTRDDCRPDEWNHIVSYYYDLVFNSVPNGWFQWWED